MQSASSATKKASSLLALLVLSVLTAGSALAKSPQEQAFEGHVAEAQRFYAAKDYDRSITELQAAHLINPIPSLLINIGRCHYLAGRPQAALTHYQQALNSKLSRTEREEVSASVAKASIELQGQQQKEAQEAAARQAALQERLAQLASSQNQQPPPPTPLYKKPWFWGIVGGVTAVGLALGLGLGLGLQSTASTSSPSPPRPNDYIPSL